MIRDRPRPLPLPRGRARLVSVAASTGTSPGPWLDPLMKKSRAACRPEREACKQEESDRGGIHAGLSSEIRARILKREWGSVKTNAIRLHVYPYLPWHRGQTRAEAPPNS